jgi:hypothetical protein
VWNVSGVAQTIFTLFGQPNAFPDVLLIPIGDGDGADTMKKDGFRPGRPVIPVHATQSRSCGDQRGACVRDCELAWVFRRGGTRRQHPL